jgi:tight adherence protein C
LTIYLEAGQPLDASLGRASRALEKSFEVVAEEAAFLIKDLDLSVDREKTLNEFGERLNTNTAVTFVNIVVQSERRGNAIAPSLRTLAKESRKEVIMDIERKAQKLPTMMQLPMFMFILPSIFASVIGPAAIQIMQTFSSGILLGA